MLIFKCSYSGVDIQVLRFKHWYLAVDIKGLIFRCWYLGKETKYIKNYNLLLKIK